MLYTLTISAEMELWLLDQCRDPLVVVLSAASGTVLGELAQVRLLVEIWKRGKGGRGRRMQPSTP